MIGLPESPFLTLEEGARFCRFDGCDKPVLAFRKWLDRQAVPIVRLQVGKREKVNADSLDASVRRSDVSCAGD